MLPIRQAIKLPLDVYYGIRFDNLSGRIVLKGKKVYRGMVKFGAQGSDMFQRKGCILAIEGTLTLEGSCVFGCSNTIKIRKGAEVTIGNGAIFGAENLLYAEKEMCFGDEFLSSWKCQFMDSDTHFIVDLQSGETTVSVKSVAIGKHCWIGNHVIVNKGTQLADNTIVASRSLVTKDFAQEGEYCVLAGIPAKVIQRNKAWAIDEEGVKLIKIQIDNDEITPPLNALCARSMACLKNARLLRTRALLNFFRSDKEFGHLGKHAIVQYPSFIDNPQNVFLDDFARIRFNATILNSPGEKVYIGKYTVFSLGLTIVTNNHRSTVGIPHYFLGASHINDQSTDIRIGEDVWGGMNVTILAGANVGRGAILAAGCLVNKPVPPYAVVAGVPARIIAVKFSKEQIMEHERLIYPPEERMKEAEIDELFEKYFKDKKVYGTSEMTEEERTRIKNIKQEYGLQEYE